MTKQLEEKTFMQWTALLKNVAEITKKPEPTPEKTKTIQDLARFLSSNGQSILSYAAYMALKEHAEKAEHEEVKPSLFLSDEKIMQKRVFSVSIPRWIHDRIARILNAEFVKIKAVSHNNLKSDTLFSCDLSLAPYAYAKRMFYHYRHEDTSLIKLFRKIYKYSLVPALAEIYNDDNIFKQVRHNHFIPAQKTDFLPQNSLTEIGLRNITQVVNLIMDLARQNQHLLSDESIETVVATHIVLSAFQNSGMEVVTDKETASYAKRMSYRWQKMDQEIRDLYTRLFMTIQHDQHPYLGFFTQLDFVSYTRDRYPEINTRRLELLFDQIVTPLPPHGIFRYDDINNSGITVSYYVPQSNIQRIFDAVNIYSPKSVQKHLAIAYPTFSRFLKRIFETEIENSGEKLIAKILRTDTDKLKRMRELTRRIR